MKALEKCALCSSQAGKANEEKVSSSKFFGSVLQSYIQLFWIDLAAELDSTSVLFPSALLLPRTQWRKDIQLLPLSQFILFRVHCGEKCRNLMLIRDELCLIKKYCNFHQKHLSLALKNLWRLTFETCKLILL